MGNTSPRRATEIHQQTTAPQLNLIFVKENYRDLLKSNALQQDISPTRTLAIHASIQRSLTASAAHEIFIDGILASPTLHHADKDWLCETILRGQMTSIARRYSTWKIGSQSREASSLVEISSTNYHGDALREFKRMFLFILRTSRRLEVLPQESRQQLRQLVLTASTESQLIDRIESLLMEIEWEDARIVIDDIREVRYYRLLLPNRFDCEAAQPIVDASVINTSIGLQDVLKSVLERSPIVRDSIPGDRLTRLRFQVSRSRTDLDLMGVVEELSRCCSPDTTFRILDDVATKSYYRLLLPDRFNCPEGRYINSSRVDLVTTSTRTDYSGTTKCTAPMDSCTTTTLLRPMPSMRGKVCPICLDPMENPMGLQKCSHVFCASCLREWIQQQEGQHSWECPMCRKSYEFRSC